MQNELKFMGLGGAIFISFRTVDAHTLVKAYVYTLIYLFYNKQDTYNEKEIVAHKINYPNKKVNQLHFKAKEFYTFIVKMWEAQNNNRYGEEHIDVVKHYRIIKATKLTLSLCTTLGKQLTS